ncbi:hypothetical protein [Anaeromyxobacter paludicola]|uniref:VWFA domain-containing protein n=1 Tax=Anaeromyxobacter paludicola TaxID=2918171 RepID=A0ABM7X626_9BACT|nr:hypothetical protein [Anaeromyxobacter paludicola]BDG07271.1 hypothetical protein AMPC_03840 [Anaeromyxobacter paludicola]
MPRRALVLPLLALLAACQSYNFNPVGQCIIQPASRKVTLGGFDTADILFVVDDSGSMLGEQQMLAKNFDEFVGQLAQLNKDRVARGLTALDFHLAVTTSSIFENDYVANCAADGSGALACSYVSIVSGKPASYACATAGQACGELVTQYYGFSTANRGCVPGDAAEGSPYPAGDFVAKPGNPRVIHFTKDLDWSSYGTATQDARITQAVGQFKANVQVGTCGSGQEQHLEAGRLALEKALRQNGLAQPADVQQSEFPHAGARLVVVWMGDEDDCSNPKDPLNGIVMTNMTPGADACMADEGLPLAQRKAFPVQAYVDYFTGLGRPFGAGFITSSTCSASTGTNVCTASTCTCPAGSDPQCSGKSTGTRFQDLATALRQQGVPVVQDSVCDADFASTLRSIADLVKPLNQLQLPTQPAAGEVTLLRIVRADGSTRKICAGPGPTADWWFTSCNDPLAQPVAGTTSCIAINHQGGGCEANPGESYLAEYLGIVPAGGCASTQECVSALGGQAQQWTCEIPTGAARGTCLCSAGN